ncbi:Nsp1-like C-terminal region-domain-containing protein [Xylaria sp. CBS 124048]|nr:Nsp1-like C-terminal region-domain-containing protein [Xylaria sp. CBS 124048]
MSFGTPSSSGQSTNPTTSTAPASPGLFGSSTTPAASGNLFGSQSKTSSFSFGNAGSGGNNATTPSSNPTAGNLFGSANGKPGEQKSLFGASSSGAPGTSTPLSSGGAGASGSLFSGLSQTPSSTDMFGSKPAGTTTTGTNLFGSGSSTPTTTAASTTPMTAAPVGSSFGQQGNTANQAKPGGLFGAGSGGSFSTTPATQATPTKTSLFPSSTTPAGAPPLDSSKPSNGLSLFGKPATQGGSSLFGPAQQGEKKENQTSNLLGGQASSLSKPATTQSATATSGAPSLFTTASQSPKLGATFGTTKPAESSSTFGAKPAGTGGTSLFGQPASSKPTETAPSTGSSLFSNATTPTASAGSTPSLFKTPAAGQPPSTSAPAPAATQTNSLFGNKPAAGTTATESQKPQSSSLFSGLSKPATSSATSDASKPANLFGTTSTSTAGTSAPATTTTTTAPTSTTGAGAGATSSAPVTASSAGSLFDANKTMPSAESTTPKPAASQSASLGASTSGPTSSMARLKNKTMDEIMSRWATDLSKYQKEFKEQATQVAAWDRLLVENGEKIQKLYLNTFEAEKASREVERHLVTVESQQEELETWLDKYELEVDALFSKQIGPGEQLSAPDQERERTYKLAEKITERLDDMSRDLARMIKEVNEISGTVNKSSKPDDPLSQIVRVLNGHLTQLQWIDTNAAALQAKIAAAQKASSHVSSQYGGPEQDNADSFYRSYMGRR